MTTKASGPVPGWAPATPLSGLAHAHHAQVQKLQRACLRNPVKVEVASKYQTVSTLRQEVRPALPSRL